jgi:hypothetical protein
MISPCKLYGGLAVYRFGQGEPVLLMPAPYPGLGLGCRASATTSRPGCWRRLSQVP